jgi:hypothetical protein
MKVRRRNLFRRDRFKPSTIRILLGWPLSIDADDIYRRWAKVVRRIILRFGSPNVPESISRGGMFTQRIAATASPQMSSQACINISKEILIDCAAMMIEAHVNASAMCAHVAAGIMIDRDVVDELCPKIKIGEQIVFAFKAKAMMSRAAKGLIRLAR